MRTCGVDVGGTGVRAALVDGSRAVHSPVRRTLPDRHPDTVIYAIRSAVREATAGHVDRVGVGIPGFVQDGVVKASPNFPSWRDVPLARRLSSDLGLPVAVDNDGNCAALGCWQSRGAKEDLVLLTLGTGIGGGVISGGQLLRGATGSGAELGHIYVGGGQRCGCGGIGCLEAWASTVGMVQRARELGLRVQDGQELLDHVRRREATAVRVLSEAAGALGRGLVSLINVFNPDVVVLTGGLTAAKALLAPPTQRWVDQHGIRANVDPCSIVWEGRADTYAMVGAAALVR